MEAFRCGHEKTPGNTEDGRCKQCRRAYQREYYRDRNRERYRTLAAADPAFRERLNRLARERYARKRGGAA